MSVGKFYEAVLQQEAVASVALDGETWSLPRFQTGQPVWVASRPAEVVGYEEEGTCKMHPGQYRYRIRFAGSPEGTSWPYCESQLRPRD